MSKIDKKIPLIIRDFHTKLRMWDTLSFLKRGYFEGLMSEILRMVGLLGENFILF